MTTGRFRHLFTPFALRHLVIPNRIVSTAHAEAMAEGGRPTPRLIRYLEEKARGGCGLIIAFGSASVHPSSPARDWGGVELFDDAVIPHLRETAEAVHRHGTRLFSQITHRGRRGTSDGEGNPLLAPSPIPERSHRETPHQMEREEILEIVEAYASAALRVKRGGFDGVEVLIGYGHLPEQFLSPFSNRRTDEYGGPLENRMRFVLQVLEAVRRAVGPDFIVGVRVSGDEKLPGGLDHQAQREIAVRLARTGLVDYFNVVGGTTENLMAQTEAVPHMWYPTGLWVHYAASIKQATGMPVIAVGRITDPLHAEWVLAQGQADLVGMTRAIIADPHMPAKAREGRLEDIRPCIGTNQGCAGRIYYGKAVACIHNPVIGRESELAEITPSPRPGRVVVVGGGPAGLEAARVAALRGHRVVLFERNARLGGQVALLAQAPGRENFSAVVQWLEGQVRKLGVEVRLGVEATAEAVLREGPQAVVIATGSSPLPPPVPGADTAPLATGDEVLSRGVDWGERVLVFDQDHFHAGAAVAEALVAPGREVEVVSELFSVGEDIDITNRPLIYQRLLSQGVRLTPNTTLKEVQEDRAVLQNVYSGEERTVEGLTALVYVGLRRAEDSLYHQLKGRVPSLHLVGDARAPRRLPDALLEGTRAGRAV